MTVSDLFPGSSLLLPVLPGETAAIVNNWIEFPLNRTLSFISIIAYLLGTGVFIGIAPYLRDLLVTKRGAIRMQHNLSTARSRNILFAINVLPLALLVDYLDIYSPHFTGKVNPSWSVLISVGAIIVYFLLRSLLYSTGNRAFRDPEVRLGTKNILNSLLLIVLPVSFISLLVLKAFHVSSYGCKIVIIIEFALGWITSFRKSMQILSANRGGFSAFLYLCAFEIAPLCLLIFSKNI